MVKKKLMVLSCLLFL